MKSNIIILICLLIGTSNEVLAKTWTPKADSAHMEFVAHGRPAMIKIKGHSEKPIEGVVNDDKGQLSGVLSLDITSLTTDIDMRDKHMKEKYLETGSFPKASLKFENLQIDSQKAGSNKFEGLLTLHGQTEKVSGSLDISKKDSAAGTLHTEAHFNVDLKKFKIDIPSYAGVTVASDVEVTVTTDWDQK